MEAIETQLKDLQKKLEDYEAQIASTQKTLQDAQTKIGSANQQRGEVASRIAALQSEVDELRDIQSAIANERKGAEGEINDANKVIQEATSQLKRKAPKELPKAVENAIKSVDVEIGGKKKAVDELRNNLSKAEEALEELQNRVWLHEKETEESKAQLRNLASQMKTTQGRVAALKNSIKMATKNEQTVEALYLMSQLKQVLEELEKLSDQRHEEVLVKQQLELQQKARAAKADEAEKSTERDQLRQNLTAAERDHQDKVSWRDTTIKTKLDALGKGEHQPGPGGAGTPTPASTGPSPTRGRTRAASVARGTRKRARS